MDDLPDSTLLVMWVLAHDSTAHGMTPEELLLTIEDMTSEECQHGVEVMRARVAGMES